MDDRYLPIIEDAVKNYRKKDGFEGALGRAVKKNGEKYETYIEIITELRGYAFSHDIDLVTAAKRAIDTAEKDRIGEKDKENTDEPYTKV